MTVDAVSRRELVRRSAVAGALVIGFDVSTRGWATAADRAGQLARGFPFFDGVLRTDSAGTAVVADDFGHIVHRRPLAVLEPGSVEDIVRLIRFARRLRIGVVARGQGHSAYGQAQVDAGVVIDMRALASVHDVDRSFADADAGATWRGVLDAALSRGLTPPTLTDYQDLSVGGTLSVGGIGGAMFRYGAQVDNVVALEVVTGGGTRVWCSSTRLPGIFEAVLAGLGQCAVITRAILRLRSAPARVRLLHLLYGDLGTFMADARAVVRDGRFDTVQGFVVPGVAGGWAYQLEVTTSSAVSEGTLLTGLHDIRDLAAFSDMTYEAFVKRLDPIVEQQRQTGVWDLPHPWFDVWLPDAQAESFAGRVLSELTLDDLGVGPIILYPTRSATFGRPLLRHPAGELIWQFDILRTALPTGTPAETLVKTNRRLYEQVREIGGYLYPVGALPVTPGDWAQHFGDSWPALVRAKRRYDPAGILAPRHNVFGEACSQTRATSRAVIASVDQRAPPVTMCRRRCGRPSASTR
jgi:FAD/FMN-containing dehydrogenase